MRDCEHTYTQHSLDTAARHTQRRRRHGAECVDAPPPDGARTVCDNVQSNAHRQFWRNRTGPENGKQLRPAIRGPDVCHRWRAPDNIGTRSGASIWGTSTAAVINRTVTPAMSVLCRKTHTQHTTRMMGTNMSANTAAHTHDMELRLAMLGFRISSMRTVCKANILGRNIVETRAGIIWFVTTMDCFF